MSIDEWVVPDPAEMTPVVDAAGSAESLTGPDFTVTVERTGYGEGDPQSGAVIRFDDGRVVVVSRYRPDRVHIQTYGGPTKTTIEPLNSGRNDLGERRDYIVVRSPK